jgi:hypothetical protein
MASVGDRWIDFYNPACFLVTCAALARKAPDLPEAAREELAEGHLRQAVAVLRHARSSSHIEPRQVRNDPAFAPLRARPDFQALLAELTAKAG